MATEQKEPPRGVRLADLSRAVANELEVAQAAGDRVAAEWGMAMIPKGSTQLLVKRRFLINELALDVGFAIPESKDRALGRGLRAVQELDRELAGLPKRITEWPELKSVFTTPVLVAWRDHDEDLAVTIDGLISGAGAVEADTLVDVLTATLMAALYRAVGRATDAAGDRLPLLEFLAEDGQEIVRDKIAELCSEHLRDVEDDLGLTLLVRPDQLGKYPPERIGSLRIRFGRSRKRGAAGALDLDRIEIVDPPAALEEPGLLGKVWRWLGLG